MTLDMVWSGGSASKAILSPIITGAVAWVHPGLETHKFKGIRLFTEHIHAVSGYRDKVDTAVISRTHWPRTEQCRHVTLRMFIEKNL